MGLRGPGSGKLRAAAKKAPAGTVEHPWDKTRMPPAERMISFLQTLPIVSGLLAGTKLKLLPSQEQFVRSVYGPLDAEDRRIVRLAYLSEARGNGKTGLMAGLGLGHLLGPMEEPHGECYGAALDREQAGVLYGMTRAIIENTPWMAARVNIRDWHKQIIDQENNSVWAALTSDARKAHGLAPSFWVADEVAQWRSRELWDNLATGMGKRAQALGVSISTQAGDDLHFFSEMLDAEPDPTTYVQVHAAPEGCALDDRAAWAAANPVLGVFRDDREFEIAAERAKRTRSFEPAFRLLYLNQRVDAEVRAVGRVEWEANGAPFDPSELEGEVCFGGLDLSSTRDLTALALWFPAKAKLLAWRWLPRDTVAEREERDRVPYGRWVDEGHIEQTPGRATDRVAIARRLASIRGSYDVRAIAYDKWRYEDLGKLLDDEGIDLPMVEFVPGWKSYAGAVDAFERALLDRKFGHGDNPVLTWQASNLVYDIDPTGNRKPTKKKSTDRIDGMVAAIMAMGVAASHQVEAQGPSVYRGRGLLMLG